MQDGQYPNLNAGSEGTVDGPDSQKENPISAISSIVNKGAKPSEAGNTQHQAGTVEILPQFSNLPKEQGVIRTLQSIKDNLMRENEELKTKLNTGTKYIDFAMNLTEDKDLQNAFIKTYRPELLQEKSVDDRVAEKLKEEFGADFTPEPDDESKRGTKTYRYWKRYDTLYSKLSEDDSGSATGIPTLKELAEKRKSEREKATTQYQTKLSKFQKERNLKDSDISALRQFISKLDFEHYWDLFQFQLLYSNTGPKPNLNQIAGANQNFANPNFGNQNRIDPNSSGYKKYMETEEYVSSILGPAPPK